MKTLIKQLLLLVTISVTFTATGSNLPMLSPAPGVTQEYRAAAKSLLQAIDFEKSVRDNLNSSFAQMGFVGQEVDDLVDELVRQMPDKMVEVYAKYFTLSEINRLVEINKTEAQTKIRNAQVSLNLDLMSEGQCLALGEPSPSADIVVDPEFEKAMREYFVIINFDTQIRQILPMIEQNHGLKSGTLNGFCDAMPAIMVRNYSKYLTTSDIRQAIALAKDPVYKKLNENSVAISKDAMEVSLQVIMDYFQNMR